MNAGTTDDSFLKDNLDWVAKACNWAKFSATSTLGMIHKRNKGKAMEILGPYLREGHVAQSPYSAAGAYYALGLIHANQYSNEVSTIFNTLLSYLDYYLFIECPQIIESAGNYCSWHLSCTWSCCNGD